VITVLKVMIQPKAERTSTYVGTAIGAAAGYAGTRHSSGSFRGLGTILGGAAGLAAGAAISGHHGAHPGLQIFVQKLDSPGRVYGSMVAVVQDADQPFKPGDTVLLVKSRDGLAVAPVSG
jgi:outer membrane lipoprotein SlyB